LVERGDGVHRSVYLDARDGEAVIRVGDWHTGGRKSLKELIDAGIDGLIGEGLGLHAGHGAGHVRGGHGGAVPGGELPAA